MTWQPLSVREGRREPIGPLEGIPEHLRYPIRHWLEGMYGYRSSGGMRVEFMMSIAASIRLSLTYAVDSAEYMGQLIRHCFTDDEAFLDVVDATLRHNDFDPREPQRLQSLLEAGGSVWTLTDDRRGLMRRVDTTATEALQAATTPTGLASTELTEAWTAVFGRSPNPSDGWDHSIKAVEAVLNPLVLPSQTRATLGGVIRELTNNGTAWKLLLGDDAGTKPVDPLVSMLNLMWVNPDRHGNSALVRTPTLDEAQAVVHLAITIVQWVRAGVLLTR